MLGGKNHIRLTFWLLPRIIFMIYFRYTMIGTYQTKISDPIDTLQRTSVVTSHATGWNITTLRRHWYDGNWIKGNYFEKTWTFQVGESCVIQIPQLLVLSHIYIYIYVYIRFPVRTSIQVSLTPSLDNPGRDWIEGQQLIVCCCFWDLGPRMA